jgi:hypothetical protein
MLILSKPQGEKIALIDNWPQPKRPDLHWQDGRSAKELARYFTNAADALPGEVEKILLDRKLLQADDFEGYPEHKTRFDQCKGEGRNHDLLLVSEVNSLVIGLEAKVDELFGNTTVISELCKPDITANKENRINDLTEKIFELEPTDPKVEGLRYQLLTATAGTIFEAMERKLTKAMLLVLVFKKEGSYDESKIRKNKRDYKKFTDMLGDQAPYHLPGYSNIDFYTEYQEIPLP